VAFVFVFDDGYDDGCGGLVDDVCLCVTVCVCFSSGCETWSRDEGVASRNGQLYPNTSLPSCLELCLGMSECVAVDVSMDTCAVHTNINHTATTFNASGFTQYTLNRTCLSSPSIAAHSAANNVTTRGTTRSAHSGIVDALVFTELAAAETINRSGP